MSIPIAFRPEAWDEFQEAALWYDQRRTGLGLAFVEAVEAVLDQIAKNPERCGLILGDVRVGLVHRFPYCVYYRAEKSQVLVLAVLHGYRDPAVWHRRI